LVREALPGFILHGTKGSFLKNRTDVQEVSLMAGQTPATPGYGIEPEMPIMLLSRAYRGMRCSYA
jgi:scyllo-inositol 2-dehydrogenase (NADP+)